MSVYHCANYLESFGRHFQLGRKVESMVSIVYFLFVAVCIDLVAISSILILYSILYSVYVYCLSRETLVNEEALELIDIESE